MSDQNKFAGDTFKKSILHYLAFYIYSYVIVPEKITLICMYIMTTLLLISELHNFHDIC